jgi:hypothetical protein
MKLIDPNEGLLTPNQLSAIYRLKEELGDEIFFKVLSIFGANIDRLTQGQAGVLLAALHEIKVSSWM